MTLVAGVDSSTQACKVEIRDLDTGALIRTGRAPHPHGTEVDPAAWWLALTRATEESGGLADVSSISIAGQQHGMVPLDASGHVIRPALLWNDTRSATAAADLVAEIGAEEYARRTGSVPVASFTCSKLRWIRDNEPENAKRIAAVALPHDWLTWRLRGFGPGADDIRGPVLDQLTTDRSEASGTGYWSPMSGRYDPELFACALGHEALLPDVYPPGDAVGATPTGTVVGAGAGDNASAALGLHLRQRDVAVSIGTSGTVFTVTKQSVVDPTGTVAGFADATGRHLPLVATLNAARVLDSIAGLLGVDNDALGDLALSSPPGAEGVVLVPYFEGERTPNRPTSRASIHGLSIASCSRENVARAAVEGMLCGLAAGLDALRNIGARDRRIILIGGAARNAAVGKIASEVFEATVAVAEPQEYVARGAAIQAAWALTGERPRWAPPALAEYGSDFHPLIRTQYSAWA